MNVGVLTGGGDCPGLNAVMRAVVRKAERADARNKVQSGWGLWHRGTPFGTGGYFHAQGYDDAESSFHILTTDGIRGRDITAD